MFQRTPHDPGRIRIKDDGTGQLVDVLDLSLLDEGAIINVGAGDDTVTATDYNDYIMEWTGDDVLDAGAGNDWIDGGRGSDIMTGGAGYDMFILWGSSPNGRANTDDGDQDVITDFTWGEDALLLRDINGQERILVTTLEELYALEGSELSISQTMQGLQVTHTTSQGHVVNVLLADPVPPAPPPALPEMTLSVLHGQSLAVGTTYWPDREVLSPDPLYPQNALMLDFNGAVSAANFGGFVPLVESSAESVSSSMVNRILQEHETAGLSLPTIAHMSGAVGGASILDLMTRDEDIHATLEAGLAATALGDHFVVLAENGEYQHFIDEGTTAYLTRTGSPVQGALLESVELQLQLAVAEAQSEGYAIADQMMFSWIQGQSDGSLALRKYDYAYHLDLLIDRVEEMAEGFAGKEIEMVVSVSQTRGFGNKGVSVQQLQVATEDGFVHLGMLEYVRQAETPERVGTGYTHLSSEGYFMAGQTLGLRMFDALTGAENAPILMSGFDLLSATQLEVSFTGADGGLVNDPGIWDPANGFIAPDHFGFELYNDDGFLPRDFPEIIGAQLTNAGTVILDFDTALDGDYRLYLGRSEENLIDPDVNPRIGNGFGGTTLRSAEVNTAMQPTDGGPLADDRLYEYAPIQFAELTFDPSVLTVDLA